MDDLFFIYKGWWIFRFEYFAAITGSYFSISSIFGIMKESSLYSEPNHCTTEIADAECAEFLRKIS